MPIAPFVPFIPGGGAGKKLISPGSGKVVLEHATYVPGRIKLATADDETCVCCDEDCACVNCGEFPAPCYYTVVFSGTQAYTRSCIYGSLLDPPIGFSYQFPRADIIDGVYCLPKTHNGPGDTCNYAGCFLMPFRLYRNVFCTGESDPVFLCINLTIAFGGNLLVTANLFSPARFGAIPFSHGFANVGATGDGDCRSGIGDNEFNIPFDPGPPASGDPFCCGFFTATGVTSC